MIHERPRVITPTTHTHSRAADGIFNSISCFPFSSLSSFVNVLRFSEGRRFYVLFTEHQGLISTRKQANRWENVICCSHAAVWQFHKTFGKIIPQVYTIPIDSWKHIISPLFITSLISLSTYYCSCKLFGSTYCHSTGKSNSFGKELKGQEDPCLHLLWGSVFSGPKLL